MSFFVVGVVWGLAKKEFCGSVFFFFFFFREADGERKELKSEERKESSFLPPSTLVALVRIDTTSEPAFGSDIAKAPTCSPESSFGRNLFFCSSLALRLSCETQRLEWAP